MEHYLYSWLSFRYKESDFHISNDVEVVGIKTVVDKTVAKTDEDVKNILITFWENAQIKYETTSTIFYKRLNHLKFKYELTVKNPKRVRNKVMIRIFLGILVDDSNVK